MHAGKGEMNGFLTKLDSQRLFGSLSFQKGVRMGVIEGRKLARPTRSGSASVAAVQC